MRDRPWACPVCDWVMPAGPGVAMTWCPCGWRDAHSATASVLTLPAAKSSSAVDGIQSPSDLEEAA